MEDRQRQVGLGRHNARDLRWRVFGVGWLPTYPGLKRIRFPRVAGQRQTPPE